MTAELKSITLTVPPFWIFTKPCGCPFGSVMSQSAGRILATEDQAWLDFFETKAERIKAEKDGVIVRPYREGDHDLFRHEAAIAFHASHSGVSS